MAYEQQSERYIPSNEIVKIALEESAPDTKRLAKEMQKLASAYHIKLKPSKESKEATFQAIRTILEELVDGTIQSSAFGNVALYKDAHQRSFPICDSNGTFTPQIANFISASLPLEKPAKFLQAIGKDLVSYTQVRGEVHHNRYVLYADSSGVHYRITGVVQPLPKLPERRPISIQRNVQF